MCADRPLIRIIPRQFLRVDVHSAFGSIFADFGPGAKLFPAPACLERVFTAAVSLLCVLSLKVHAGFTVSDTNGENPHSAIVSHITNSNPAIVTVPNDDQALIPSSYSPAGLGRSDNADVFPVLIGIICAEDRLSLELESTSPLRESRA